MRIALLVIILGSFFGYALAQSVSYTCTTPTNCTEQDIYTKKLNPNILQIQINVLTNRLKQLQQEQSQINAAINSSINQNNGVQPPSMNGV